MQRRKFLSLAGGGVVLAATATFGTIATRQPTNALAPWGDAGALYQEPRRRALSYAILAPNPHNQQPWLVDLSIPDKVVLHVNRTRLLPHTDPLNRQITIGLGCFLELMVMAAAEDGYAVDLEVFPEGADITALDDRPVAIATFRQESGTTPDPLFAHVMQRRSNKEPFDTTRKVEPETLAAIQTAARHGSRIAGDVSDSGIAALRKITTDALIVEIETPHAFKESVDLFRIGKAEIEANPDGIDFSGPMFETLGALGLMTREGTLDPTSTMFAQGKAAVLENAQTAMGHLWQTTTGNTRFDQIDAGRDWVRLNLAATAFGVGMQPLSQALQEYPEMASHYAQIHQMLAQEGETVQMLCRLGYGVAIGPSPRWPLEAKLI
ncbi:twin-arginine translocation pathway signal protein [Cognatiyoonia sp. IB215446]|uniref:Acg family FMN-binding oxidoreductase n=1 Tax=Cognatiyoonia sp. IB215446 TaxID=3097355 RepID=UPI002A147EBB|nr:twin-arginine translocation pathway signal protein [Cognatiyoonia sp. IB215446]MDX8347515.1 twin-arginine translocation pathway signal protein [Cognatiyoonia sp. IB215446]